MMRTAGLEVAVVAPVKLILGVALSLAGVGRQEEEEEGEVRE